MQQSCKLPMVVKNEQVTETDNWVPRLVTYSNKTAVCVNVALLRSLHCYVKVEWYMLTLCSSSGVGDRISCISSLILLDSHVFSDMRSVLLLFASLRRCELFLRGLMLAWLPDSLWDLVLSTPKLTVLPVIMEAWVRGEEPTTITAKSAHQLSVGSSVWNSDWLPSGHLEMI